MPHSFQTNPIFVKILMLLMFISACTPEKSKSYNIQVYQTSQSGDNLKLVSPKEDETANPDAAKLHLKINSDKTFQQFVGFGASFTESSAWNLATIPEALRKEVLTKLFSPSDGAGFSLTRTHINSSDYSNNHYTYVKESDTELASFSIYEDMKGFTGDENDQVNGIALVEANYDLIPMIKEAQNIHGADFKIIASPWSPPSWMKSGETSEMTNGSLLPEHYRTWAKYLSKYVSAYADQGINIWGITPQNEPLHAHDARWDSNGLTPEQGRDFLRDHLGPQLVEDGHLDTNDLEAGLRVIIYDHNKSTMNDYVSATYNDPEASKYAWGTGFHWYANSELGENNWYADELDILREKWPEKGMIHTESSIDIDANDPIGQYWRESTDYAGTFIPFDTYANDILMDINHGAQGYIEWCMILSHKGQPNPYDNFNSAPILINPNTDEIIYTPLYYLLSHFSKFIRPDAHRIEITGDHNKGIVYTAAKNPDGSIVAVIYNQTTDPIHLELELDSETYMIELEAQALQTIQFKLQ
ncbi:MAG: glycoside hydrolase family 30 beta sandwich domain-containing protein [Crocinitomicaceae bacterium]